MSTGWTKWWWLRLQSFPIWSTAERRAAGAFYGIFLVSFLFATSAFAFYLSRLKFDLNVTLTAAIAVSLLAVIPSVRGLASKILPGIIEKGDQAAAERTDSTAFLPEQSPGLWWINYGAGTGEYSREERFIMLMIFLIAMLVFCPTALYLPAHLMDWFDVSKRTSILTTMVTMLPLSYFISRRFSTWIWPEVTRRADENAWARFNR
jgi:hypothetical protein